MTCLIDTGSHATLVNLSLIRDLKLDRSIRKTSTVLSSFTKDKITTVGEITLDLTIAGTRAPHTCIVVSEEMECQILLGMDFLSPNPISLEPYDNLTANDNLLVAAALTYIEKGDLPIRIISPTDELIVVYKRKLLGFMNPTETNKRFREVQIYQIGKAEVHTPTP